MTNHKTSRFEMRVSQEEKAQLERAAKQVGIKTSAYVLQSALRRSEDMGIMKEVRTHKNQCEMFA